MSSRALTFGVAAGLFAATFLLTPSLSAQQAPAAPAGTPRAQATSDYTGYWVAYITEDWRWRMVTPPKGDFTSIPLSDEGRRVAGQWDPASDGSCQAFGAAGLMRQPTRLRVSWEGNDLLKVESDNGVQTRLLQFSPKGQPAGRSLQGYSVAEWEPVGGTGARGGRGGGQLAMTLKVVTTSLQEGWLRRNGIAYSEATTLTEYWDRVAFPNGDVLLTVSQYVNDPKYLTGEYTTSMHFKREPDGSKWRPAPCRQL